MHLLKKSKSGMLILDLVISLTIIGFLIWVFGGIIGRLSKNAQETALRYQLHNFRMLIVLYKELKGHYPEDLKVLIQSRHRLSNADELIFDEKFLGKLKQDKHKNPVDTFGNSLYYDAVRGMVGSTTKGYKNW